MEQAVIVSSFISGVITMGFALAALFFFRFWRRTNDYLFVAFAGAFVLMALNQMLIGLTQAGSEGQFLLYVPRLLAFILLIGVIIAKNSTRADK